jgi:hypothetical protein
MSAELAVVTVSTAASLAASLAIATFAAFAARAAAQGNRNVEVELRHFDDEKRGRIRSGAALVARAAVQSIGTRLPDASTIVVDPVAVGILAV